MTLKSRVTRTQAVEMLPVGTTLTLDNRRPYSELKAGPVPPHKLNNMRPGHYFIYEMDIDNRPGAMCLVHEDEVDNVSDVHKAAEMLDTIDLPSNPADAHTVSIIQKPNDDTDSLASSAKGPVRFGGIMDVFTKETNGQVSIIVLDVESQLITTPMLIDSDAPDEFPALSNEPEGVAWDYTVASDIDLGQLESEDDCEVVYLNGLTRGDVEQFTNARMTALRSPGWEDGFVQNINTGTLHLTRPDGSERHVIFVTDYKHGREGIRDMFKQMNERAESFARARAVIESLSDLNISDKQL